MGEKTDTNFISKECSQKIKAIDDTMYIMSGKWKINIIARLCYKPMRYSELLRDLNGISGKMLSRELKELEMNNIITRKVISTQPLSVVYDISEHGQSLKLLTDSLADWGLQHRKKFLRAFDNQ